MKKSKFERKPDVAVWKKVNGLRKMTVIVVLAFACFLFQFDQCYGINNAPKFYYLYIQNYLIFV